jgi:hypothetical protein
MTMWSRVHCLSLQFTVFDNKKPIRPNKLPVEIGANLVIEDFGSLPPPGPLVRVRAPAVCMSVLVRILCLLCFHIELIPCRQLPLAGHQATYFITDRYLIPIGFKTRRKIGTVYVPTSLDCVSRVSVRVAALMLTLTCLCLPHHHDAACDAGSEDWYHCEVVEEDGRPKFVITQADGTRLEHCSSSGAAALPAAAVTFVHLAG